jgi:MFS family permease
MTWAFGLGSLGWLQWLPLVGKLQHFSQSTLTSVSTISNVCSSAGPFAAVIAGSSIGLDRSMVLGWAVCGVCAFALGVAMDGYSVGSDAALTVWFAAWGLTASFTTACVRALTAAALPAEYRATGFALATCAAVLGQVVNAQVSGQIGGNDGTALGVQFASGCALSLFTAVLWTVASRRPDSRVEAPNSGHTAVWHAA